MAPGRVLRQVRPRNQCSTPQSIDHLALHFICVPELEPRQVRTSVRSRADALKPVVIFWSVVVLATVQSVDGHTEATVFVTHQCQELLRTVADERLEGASLTRLVKRIREGTEK